MLKGRKSVIGLDIGGNCIKAVEITHDKYDYIITGFAKVEVVNEAARADALADLFRQGHFRTKKVATAVSGQGVFVRYLNMAQMSEDNLVNAIRFEADKYIPFNVDEVQLEAQKLESVAGAAGATPAPAEAAKAQEMRVLMVAVKKTQVEDLAAMIVRTGLMPVGVGVDAFALGNAFEVTEQLSPGIHEQNRILALVDVGANKTCINILRNSVSAFTREVYIGGNDLTNALMRRQGIEMLEAERLKKDPQDHLDDVKSAVTPVLEDLGNEINLSLDYFENQFDSEVGEVLLSGGTALLPFLEEAFERIFEKKTRVWNPLEGLKVKADNVDVDTLNRFAPQLAVAVGLAVASV